MAKAFQSAVAAAGKAQAGWRTGDMIEVFKTNVQHAAEAGTIAELLAQHFPGCRIVFDLEDCDRIMKITGPGFLPEKVQHLVKECGFSCEVLE